MIVPADRWESDYLVQMLKSYYIVWPRRGQLADGSAEFVTCFFFFLHNITSDSIRIIENIALDTLLASIAGMIRSSDLIYFKNITIDISYFLSQ